MFGKKKKLDPNSTDTVIGGGTLFEGNLKSEASMRIEGNIIGDIECAGDLTIGEYGHLTSNIVARDVAIAGVVKGNVFSKGKVTITSKGSILGDIVYESLIIEEGATFQGNSRQELQHDKSTVKVSEPSEVVTKTNTKKATT